MERPYVEELRIENYGCIRDATFRFTPLHALIGPNDSGKSTVLRALRTIAYISEGGIPNPSALLSAIRASKAGTKFKLSGPNTVRTLRFDQHGNCQGMPNAAEARPMLRGTQLLRLDPDFLRAPHVLIADGTPLRFVDERGTGLPALYDALVVRDLPAYIALNEQLTRLFPSVKSIQLMNPTPSTKAMGVRLVDGTVVPADQMSEGLLYYLAFAVLPYLDSTSLLLIEEPENGLHPARIAEVMRVLRDISSKTQVLIATHSPLVVNELQPEEVTVVTRSREAGTKATPLQETPNFEERSKVYALGELWLSYANGEDEAPLLQGGPRP
jgi:predicted ATPase